MIKLVIPTRNRPGSLSRLLAYLDRFYPATKVVVADGSTSAFKAAVAASTEGYARLSVDYRSYPEELPLSDRILDVVQAQPDDFIAVGADDDFPMIDALERAQRFMRAHPDYGLGMGTMLLLDLETPREIAASIRAARPITHEQADGRVRQFAAWPWPLSYAVCRRDVLITRYKNSSSCPLGELFDMLAGLHDCLEGKVHAVPEISVVITRHFRENYWRVRSRMEFLERGPDIAATFGLLARASRTRAAST